MLANSNPLWNYPIWSIPTGLDAAFNQQILKDLASVGHELAHDAHPKDSLWDYPRPHLQKLRDILEELTNAVIKRDIPEIADLNITVKCTMAWPNVRTYGQEIELHAHPDASFVATYYVKTPSDCGDLICYLQDGAPLAITPMAGSVVILPSYILHRANPNHSHDYRVSISTDFTAVLDKQAPNALVLKSWCDDMQKVQYAI